MEPDSTDSIGSLQDAAKRILRGESATAEQVLKLAGALTAQRDFSSARRLLARARQIPGSARALQLKLVQQHALCTYKDPNLPADQRLDRALEILTESRLEDVDTTKDQETLGLLGAIHKRRWEVYGARQHLELALYYYLRGFEQGPGSDFGYTGINAAFVLDLLAHGEALDAARAGTVSASAEERRAEAKRIRETLVAELPQLANAPLGKWWFLVTVAEAYFGLRRYDEATTWLKKARSLPRVADWELESTARQLARLSQILDGGKQPDPAAVDALRVLLGDRYAAAESFFFGKVGLALSGGGFRASLFHIGVLARLAEVDALRHVEALSCVSGGSILGAHYYLEVRRLLQTKGDAQITQADYIEMVQRLERNFLAGVQGNVRMRVVGNLLANLKMIFLPSYSRTMRLGELYELMLYRRVADGESGPRWLNGLFVRPRDEADDFQPKIDNWKRANKVPVLMLNATTLNTGHNWQFTASWMGEPPTSIDSEVDAADRLRRMYYKDAPARYKNVRLGHAVAASSCVPGLFEPLALEGLYPDRIVRLVDGGVYDNQGIAGLLGEDCTVLLISDASGLIASEKKPGAGVFSVPLRSNSILMARVRGAEYHDLAARRRALLLRGLMFLHLKKDLDVTPVDWIDCPDPIEASEDYEQTRPAGRRGPLTTYGVLKVIQEKLAGVRTDLDTFCDAEAFAVMLSGYRMASHEFANRIDSIPVTEKKVAWRFLEVAHSMDRDAGFEAAHTRLAKLLDVAKNIAFKVWLLDPRLRVLGIVLLAAAAVGLLWSVVTGWDFAPSTPTVGAIVKWCAAYVIAAAVPTLWKIVHYRETTTHALKNFAIATLGFIVAWTHIGIFDRLYLSLGRIRAGAPVASAGVKP